MIYDILWLLADDIIRDKHCVTESAGLVLRFWPDGGPALSRVQYASRVILYFHHLAFVTGNFYHGIKFYPTGTISPACGFVSALD